MALVSSLPECRKTLLIVDDDPFVTDLVGRMVTRASYRAIIVNNAAAGLTAAQKQRPDGILLDLAMPEVDGFAFLHHKQEMADLAAIPVIVLSALHRDADVQLALKLGARGYVTKPVEEKTLLARLGRLIPNPLYGRHPTTRVVWQSIWQRS